MSSDEYDESSFVPRPEHPMELNDVKIELAKLKERQAAQKSDVGAHDAEFRKVWSIIEKLTDRITDLEKKIIFASGLAAGGGALAGQVIGYFFKP